MTIFKALHADSITLHLITDENLDEVLALFQGFPDSEEMIAELCENYVPKVEAGKLVRYGFYITHGTELAGMTLLAIDDWRSLAGSTGADIFLHQRGKGFAPRSKPHLFYLAFEMLGLNRVVTGCFVSNLASKKSIEKTIGFEYEGTARQSGINDAGLFEDEHIYAILRQDWLKHYDKTKVEVIY